jgi:hypothetical protein
MMQELDPMDVVKRRFGFEAWRARTSRSAPRFVWNLGFRGDELPEFTTERVERIDLTALFEREALSEQRAAAARMSRPMPTAHVQTIWRDVIRREVRVRVDVFETASVPDAWELVAWLLGEFESPLVEPKDSVGEIGFGGREEGVRLFSRANLVYLLRNIGRRPAPVLQAAIALDADVVSHPPAMQPPRAAPAEARAAPAEAAAEEGAERVEVPLEDASTAREGPQQCRKFFAPAGEIRMSRGQIVYRGPRAGLRELGVHEVPYTAPRRNQ